MANKKVFIVGDRTGIQAMFQSRGWGIVECINSADLVHFCSFSAIDPFWYSEWRHPCCFPKAQTDVNYELLWRYCISKGKRMAGVGTAGDLLNVLSGGKMWQYVDGHNKSPHDAVCEDTLDIIPVNSFHIQMMNPSDEAKILLTAGVSTMRQRMSPRPGSVPMVVTVHKTASEQPLAQARDIEAVYYESTGCLCFTPIPHLSERIAGSKLVDAYFGYINRHLFQEV